MKNKYIKLLIVIIAVFSIDYAADYVLKHGLDMGMGLNEHSKMFIVGHSQLMMGLDRDILEAELGCHVSKHTRTGVGVAERRMMTEMFLNSEYSDSLQVVVVGVDPFSFNNVGLSQNCYMLFYPWMDEGVAADYIKAETDAPTYYAHKLFRLSRYGDDLVKQSLRGWKHDDRNYKTAVMTEDIYNGGKGKWERPILFNPILVKELKLLIKEVTDRNIKVVLAMPPSYYMLTEKQKDEYDKIVELYTRWADSSELVYFFNYDKNLRKEGYIFFDPLHLNVEGQQILTQRFVKDVIVNGIVK